MKVLLLFSSSELGGAERSLSRMAMASKKVDYKLATVEGEGAWCDWLRSIGIEPLVFGSGNYNKKVKVFIAVARLYRYLRKNPVDIIYVCGLRVSILVRVLSFFSPSSKIVHGVRWNPDSNTWLDISFRFSEKLLRLFVDYWITNSEAAKNTLTTRCGVPEDKVQVIYNGVDFFPSEVISVRDKDLSVITIANFSSRKGHIEYLKVIKNVLEKVPLAQFIFIGRDDMNGQVQQAIISEGLNESVFYKGFKTDVRSWLMRSRLFVLPSLWGEGCPTSILESFACGVPVVAYNIDGIPELINNNCDGYSVSIDSGQLTNCIVDLLLDDQKNERMGKVGREKIMNKFLVDTCSNYHISVFKKLVNE